MKWIVKHKCYISFKTEDESYKEEVQQLDGAEYLDKSLDEAIDSENVEYILQVIRDDYMSGTTVTIHLIGQYSAESAGEHEQRFIKRELQASLFEGRDNTQNGILGVVLPSMTDAIYKGKYSCSICGGSHNHVAIGDQTVVKEFSHNYYIPNDKCAHSEDDRYCVLVKWDDFVHDAQKYIQAAYDKREAPIASKTKVRP